jgi:hypothetical protein
MSGTLTAELQRSLPDLVWLVRRLQLDAQAVLAVAGGGTRCRFRAFTDAFPRQ